MAPDPINVSSLAYSERQLVVVARDEVVAAIRAAKTPPSGARWTDIAKTIGTIVAPMTVTLTELAGQALEAWVNARQSGLNVLQVSRSEAAFLTFPPGHPRDGVLYVGHPAIATTYFTAASFHRLAFEHKFSEAIELLMHLGATTINVEHLRGWSREFAAHLSVPISSGVVDAGTSASGRAASTASLLYEATFRGSDQPVLPGSLAWYQHEPTWQAMAQGRIRFGLKTFSLTVNYDDDFGIDAGLGVTARKVGLELGGKFTGHEATTWKLAGAFASG